MALSLPDTGAQTNNRPMKNLFLTLTFSAAFGMTAMAQSDAKQEPVKQQEPAKKEPAKPAPAAAPAPAAEQSKTEGKPGATEKMAITEQGVDKNKGNKKKSASATTTPPATEEKKK